MRFLKFALIFLFVLPVSKSLVGQTQDGPIPEELVLRVVERNHDDVSDSARWELKVQYPEVRLKGDKPAVKFNDLARKLVMDGVTDFKNRMSQLSVEERDHLPEGANFYYETGYTVEYLSERMVSVSFNNGEYTGGAHPNNSSFALNFDLENEKILKLEGLFSAGSDFLNTISKICIAEIKEQQGENGSNDWIEGGAGPELENFENWTVTKDGLKFAFDQYIVGPYAAGRFEVLIPFEKFSDDMRRVNFEKIVSEISDKNEDRFMCRNGLFTSFQGDFMIGTVKMAKGERSARSYFYEDSDECPEGENCRLKSYVVSNDKVIVAEAQNGFYCAWYEPKTGSETVGWIRRHELSIESPDLKPGFAQWIGEWESNGNTLRIAKGIQGGNFRITGNAFWRGVGDNIHIGEVDDTGTPNGNSLNIGGPEKYDCRVKMTLVNDLLVVSDNRMCGGVNVTFDGVYRKTR
ncbi:MAG: DUF3298 and DUF4163 domain-containing protein [Pyrinomonadaceae bacterium]